MFLRIVADGGQGLILQSFQRMPLSVARTWLINGYWNGLFECCKCKEHMEIELHAADSTSKRVTVCPTCGTEFEARTNLARKGNVLTVLLGATSESPEEENRMASMVRCPSCGLEYPSREVRFFRILTPAGLRTTIALVVIAILLSAVIFFQR